MNNQDYYLYINTKYKLTNDNISKQEKQELKWILEEIENHYNNKGENNEA